jgi:carboxymethylenebutenolidase
VRPPFPFPFPFRPPTARCRYCYGAALTASLDKAGATAASAYVHPSMVSKADVAALKNPSTFAVAESDQFDAPMLAYVRETLPGAEVVSYPGTCHGFAARGDLRIDSVREGCEGALVQVVNWFRTHLA